MTLRFVDDVPLRRRCVGVFVLSEDERRELEISSEISEI